MIWIILIAFGFLVLLLISKMAKTKNRVFNIFLLVGFFGSLIYMGFQEIKFYSNNIQLWQKYFDYIYLPVYTDETQQFFLNSYYTDLVVSNEDEMDFDIKEKYKFKFSNGDIMYVDKDSSYAKFKSHDSDTYIVFSLDAQFYNYINNMW